MTYYYTGSIILMGFKNQFRIEDILPSPDFESHTMSDGNICIEPAYEQMHDISYELDQLAHVCMNHGVTISPDSYLTYTGDDDGRFVFVPETNEWSDLSRSEAEIMDASDEDLIVELLSRNNADRPALWNLIFTAIELSCTRDNFGSDIWSNGDEILCDKQGNGDKAAAIADFINTLLGDDNGTVTGYYDPKEDLDAGISDKFTGWWYVRPNQ